MPVNFHDSGEEFETKYIFTEEVSKPFSLNVGLYSESTDNLGESDNYGDITTEPTDGNYAPLTYEFGTNDFSSTYSGGNWHADLASKSFDVTDTTGTVDAYYVSVDFDGVEQLYWTADLDGTYDLSNHNTLTFSDGGLTRS